MGELRALMEEGERGGRARSPPKLGPLPGRRATAATRIELARSCPPQQGAGWGRWAGVTPPPGRPKGGPPKNAHNRPRPPAPPPCPPHVPRPRPVPLPLPTSQGADVCWICLDGARRDAPLTQACKCPRLSHEPCRARWQLQSAGSR